MSGRPHSSTAHGLSTALASLVRHAKFLEKIGKSTWRLIMKYFLKWEIEEEMTGDDVVYKKKHYVGPKP